jgi:hypothetical protein
MAQSNETVTVACKIPNGLVMRLFEMVPGTEPVMGGGSREVKVSRQKGPTITLNGPSVRFGDIPPFSIVGGYALTPNVPADFFEEWKKQNSEQMFIKNNLIFAHGKTETASDRAREQNDVKSGLERIDPEKLPKGIQKADKK